MNSGTAIIKQPRKRRSVKLLASEWTAYKKKVDGFETKRDAAEFFDFSVVTLDAVYLKGSGKPETIEGIREKLKNN